MKVLSPAVLYLLSYFVVNDTAAKTSWRVDAFHVGVGNSCTPHSHCGETASTLQLTMASSANGDGVDDLRRRRIIPLDLENKLCTVISITRVASAEEQHALCLDLAASLPNHSGLVSAAIHKSILDDDDNGSSQIYKVAEYSQWEDIVSYQEAVAAGAYSSTGSDTHIYTIFDSACKYDDATPVAIKPPFFVHFAEFSILGDDDGGGGDETKNNQEEMIRLAKQYLPLAMPQEGLLSASFHASSDYQKVINYGQWKDVESIQALKKQPGFANAADAPPPYWHRVAKNEHSLYELAATIDGGTDI